MDAVSWRKEIAKALDGGAVLGVMRSFIASLDAADAAALPQELRNSPPKTPEDISYWAFVLTRAWLDSGAGSGDAILVLGRVSLVFSDAARRLAQFGRERETAWRA